MSKKDDDWKELLEFVKEETDKLPLWAKKGMFFQGGLNLREERKKR